MKKEFLTFIAVLSFTLVWGQKDTTVIKFGDKKIIIIEQKDDFAKKEKELQSKKEKLEQGKKEFETMIEELEKQKTENEKQLEELQEQMNTATDEEVLKRLEESLKRQEEALENLEKQQKALEKGVQDIEDELESEADDFEKFDWDDEDFEENDDDRGEHFDFPFCETKGFDGQWAGFEMGLNNWVNSDFKFTLDPNQNFELVPEKSWVFTLNFIEFNIPFGKRNGLVTGMGTNWNLYHFRNNITLTENEEGVIVAEPENAYELSKNKLMLWYLNVPLIYEFQIPVGNSPYKVHFGFGAVGSLKLLSKYTQKYNGDKYKDKSDFQIPGFKYGLTFRVGYRYINLFANYDLSPLFKENRGPELFPVSAGLVILNF